MTTADPAPRTPELPLAPFTVLNALQLDLVACPAEADVRSIARTMAEHSVHCVLVTGLDPGDWGIVSDLDLMAALGPDVTEATAGQLAATDALVVEPVDTRQHAAQLMAEHQTSHAVVVDPVTGDPAGIISTLDVARWAAA